MMFLVALFFISSPDNTLQYIKLDKSISFIPQLELKSCSPQFVLNFFYLFTMVNAKKFLYKSPFKGEPKVTDFQLVKEELPDLQENGK